MDRYSFIVRDLHSLLLAGLPALRKSSPLCPTKPTSMRGVTTSLGKRFGRRPKLTKHQAREVLKRVKAGEPMREIALSYNVDHSTISRLKARHAAEIL